MVPQQQDSPSSSGIPMFGSLLVDKNSATPYSDATQVRTHSLFIYLLFILLLKLHIQNKNKRKYRLENLIDVEVNHLGIKKVSSLRRVTNNDGEVQQRGMWRWW
ncbi:hypothetical protein HZH66_012638 [Vespula vulgaris]|uniref:Uncharacterized protein n=1 Tax=Vespula vulgaris TaxID=7454 RepID=A0A834J9F4_VESVU|nr:hypothetical protein HZH66_012638 [Vespula vulgaris]